MLFLHIPWFKGCRRTCFVYPHYRFSSSNLHHFYYFVKQEEERKEKIPWTKIATVLVRLLFRCISYKRFFLFFYCDFMQSLDIIDYMEPYLTPRYGDAYKRKPCKIWKKGGFAMSNERKRGQESHSDFSMEIKHLAVEIEKGLNLSNLAQSIDQQMTSQSGATQSNTSSDSNQGKKE